MLSMSFFVYIEYGKEVKSFLILQNIEFFLSNTIFFYLILNYDKKKVISLKCFLSLQLFLFQF